MKDNILISGNNFCGRSESLKKLLSEGDSRHKSSYIGPYAETALSGFATYVSEEIYIYHGDVSATPPVDFFPQKLLARKNQRVSALSGGEQVLLALYCFAGSRLTDVGIDTALEQLDPANRARIFSYLRSLRREEHFILIDNMIEGDVDLPANTVSLQEDCRFPLYMCGLQGFLPAILAPTIEIRHLDFSYNSLAQIFNSVSIILNGGTAYRLRGDNGTGKSTFLKILAGVLQVADDMIFAGGYPYRPSIHGNSLMALSMQNPDDQWAGTSIQKDIQCKLRALHSRLRGGGTTKYDILESLPSFGLPRNPEYHLLDLPKALRKRLSWLWPLSGSLPWIAFDEPTIGQDRDTVQQFANLLNELARKGYGLIFITHNERFAEMINHKELLFQDRCIVGVE